MIYIKNKKRLSHWAKRLSLILAALFLVPLMLISQIYIQAEEFNKAFMEPSIIIYSGPCDIESKLNSNQFIVLAEESFEPFDPFSMQSAHLALNIEDGAAQMYLASENMASGIALGRMVDLINDYSDLAQSFSPEVISYDNVMWRDNANVSDHISITLDSFRFTSSIVISLGVIMLIILVSLLSKFNYATKEVFNADNQIMQRVTNSTVSTLAVLIAALAATQITLRYFIPGFLPYSLRDFAVFSDYRAMLTALALSVVIAVSIDSLIFLYDSLCLAVRRTSRSHYTYLLLALCILIAGVVVMRNILCNFSDLFPY